MNIKTLAKNIFKAISTTEIFSSKALFTVLLAALALTLPAVKTHSQAYIGALDTYYIKPNTSTYSTKNAYYCNYPGPAKGASIDSDTIKRSFINAVLTSIDISYYTYNSQYDIDDPRGATGSSRALAVKNAWDGNRNPNAPLDTAQAWFYNNTSSDVTFDSLQASLAAHVSAVNRQAAAAGIGNNAGTAANSKFSCSYLVKTDVLTISSGVTTTTFTAGAATDCSAAINIPKKTIVSNLFTVTTTTTGLNIVYNGDTYIYLNYSPAFPPINSTYPYPPAPAAVTYTVVNGQVTTAQQTSLDKVTDLSDTYVDHGMYGTKRYTVSYNYSDLNTSGEYTNNDPFKVSSLIEFDLPHNYNNPITTFDQNSFIYPNHCLELCVTVRCQPEEWSGAPNATGTPTFPIQKVTVEVFKFLEQRNPLSSDDSPAIRTIEVYPEEGNNYCYGYNACSEVTSDLNGNVTGCSSGGGFDGGYTSLEDLRKQKLTFCVPWDGTYNFDSEFAKTNGTFGFRGRVETKFQPSPLVSENPITVDTTAAFPGRNQVPIQVDVTNVHTVRATATVVGTTSKVAAKPYLITYRLSKDAKVQMLVLDANVTDKELLKGTKVVPSDEFISYNNNYSCSNTVYASRGAEGTTTCSSYPSTECQTASPIVRRTVVDGADRLGENPPDGGQVSTTTATVEQEAFNGMDYTGKFLPSGNYLVSIQAKTTDEWGIDMSRTQEAQISLDPLKFTDVAISGLNKQSTAYAQLGYFLTEPATVHIEVHKPGTTFETVYTPYDSTYGFNNVGYLAGGRPKPQQNNTLVHTITEQKAGRTAVSSKWDGKCNLDPSNVTGPGESACTTKGQPMNDGDYVYIMWAEIPYTDANGAVEKYLRGDCAIFDAVRTVQYQIGSLPVERGLVDITIQPVGYSTIGSSPAAYGLDPFMFRYSISREAPVTAVIKDTEGKNIVKTLVNSEVQVAQQMNVYSWNGIDDEGRYVSPGIYMFEVTTRDPLFPNDATKVYTQTTLFPIDMFRIVDVADTALQGENNGRATVSYTLSKSMNVELVIFDKGTVIPVPSVMGNQNNYTLATSQDRWGQICAYPGDYPFAGKGCIYYADTVAVPPANYPSTRQDPITGTGIPDELQPVKYFKATSSGEGKRITETWDGYSSLTRFKTIVPDGKYPYMIKGMAQDPGNQYYQVTKTGDLEVLYPPTPLDYLSGRGIPIYATDKPTGYITIARGSVYFLNDSIKVSASNPALYHSTETVYIPTYTIEFALSRVAEVNITIVSTESNGCGEGVTGGIGTPCRKLTKSVDSVSSEDYKIFEAVNLQRVYWDGKNEAGNYVKPGAFEVHFQANGYPSATSTTGVKTYETEEIRLLNANLFQVFDVFLTDIKPASPTGLVQYQTSFPGKVAIQIFKPETKIKAVNTNGGLNTRIDLVNPSTGEIANSDQEVLVKSIVGIRPPLTELTELWDGRDYAFQEVPDGTYPFRFVSAIDAHNIDSVTGAVVCANPNANTQCQEYVADWNAYSQLGYIVVSRGDANFVCSDWESANIFYPNPFRADNGTFEITKLPVPGEYSLKIYNLAGDLIRTKGFPCIDRRNNTVTLNDTIRIEPDQNVAYYNSQYSNTASTDVNIRNAELKCTWDKKNDAGKKVARGIYFAIADFKGTHGGAEHCQKVVKILIP